MANVDTSRRHVPRRRRHSAPVAALAQRERTEARRRRRPLSLPRARGLTGPLSLLRVVSVLRGARLHVCTRAARCSAPCPGARPTTCACTCACTCMCTCTCVLCVCVRARARGGIGEGKGRSGHMARHPHAAAHAAHRRGIALGTACCGGAPPPIACSCARHHRPSGATVLLVHIWRGRRGRSARPPIAPHTMRHPWVCSLDACGGRGATGGGPPPA
mmetsp:Transcript_73309/g.201328  ORF Transcript_73309/g.201328 Transcript_73309/m.201328 type:complete len:217 (-) Transcript_73309:404-1054(-)